MTWTHASTPPEPGDYIVRVGGSNFLATWNGRWFDGYRFIDARFVKGWMRIPDFTDCEGVS